MPITAKRQGTWRSDSAAYPEATADTEQARAGSPAWPPREAWRNTASWRPWRAQSRIPPRRLTTLSTANYLLTKQL